MRVFSQALVAAFVFATPVVAVDTMPVDGAVLPYVSAGEGTPVVFVHGAISDHRVWLPLKDAIADERRFVAYDQRYYGTAEWDAVPQDFSPDVHADDLIAFVEGLGDGPVNLVTWSYSGDVGTRAALKRPDLFRAMVHYEPAIGSYLDGVPGAGRVTSDLFAKFGPEITAMQADQLEDSALRFIEAVFDLPEGGAAEEPEPWPSVWRENGHTVPVYVKQKPGDEVTCPELEGLNIPTLVIVGSDSHPRFAMMGERMVQCQPQAMLARLDGVNHDGPYRKPADLAEMIENFLELVE
jgi:pimeloyl-ACP methyl ester carboxylesterase